MSHETCHDSFEFSKSNLSKLFLIIILIKKKRERERELGEVFHIEKIRKAMWPLKELETWNWRGYLNNWQWFPCCLVLFSFAYESNSWISKISKENLINFRIICTIDFSPFFFLDGTGYNVSQSNTIKWVDEQVNKKTLVSLKFNISVFLFTGEYFFLITLSITHSNTLPKTTN